MQGFNQESVVIEGLQNTMDVIRGLDEKLSDHPTFNRQSSIQSRNNESNNLSAILKNNLSLVSIRDIENQQEMMLPPAPIAPYVKSRTQFVPSNPKNRSKSGDKADMNLAFTSQKT